MTDVFRSNILAKNMPISDMVWLINSLPVNMLDFAIFSGMRARMYSIQTHCDPDCWKRQWFNQCARDNVWRILVEVQQSLFATKRWVLSPTYYKETVMWKLGNVFSTTFPYIEKVNVRPVFTEIGNANVSPFLQTGITPVPSGSSFFEAGVDESVVHDAERIILRELGVQVNAPVYHVRLPQTQWGYPYNDGVAWQYAMGDDVNGDSVLHAQDCDYVFIDIDPEIGIDMSDIVFVHESQDQVIPQAAPPEVAGNKWRYWFYYWMLKRPEYADSKVYLSDARVFDKFYDTLRYGVIEEVETPATIFIKPDSCARTFDESTQTAMLSVVNGIGGQVVALPATLDTSVVPNVYRPVCSTCTGLCDGYPYALEYYYKSNPYHYGLYVAGVERLRSAIVAKVAANIPLEMCDCQIEKGSYVDYMREELPDIVAVPLAQPYYHVDYGFRRGDRDFEHAVQNTAIRKRSVVL